MPPPSAAAVKADIVSQLLPPDFLVVTPDLLLVLTAITTALETAWTAWAASLTLAGNDVSGSGIGAWTGAGGGGKLAGSPMAMATIPSFPAPDLAILLAAIDAELMVEFSTWLASYTVTSMSYTGTSTATPSAPGNFTAQNDIVTLLAAGVGTDPAGLSLNVPMALATFILPLAKIAPLLSAIETAITNAWITWIGSATISGDVANGVAVAGTGTGTGVGSGGKIS